MWHYCCPPYSLYIDILWLLKLDQQWSNNCSHNDPTTHSARATIWKWYNTSTSKTLCKHCGAVILLMCDCFSQQFLWLKQLLGHKNQNHTSSWKLYSEVVTDVLLFKSVEFVSVSIDCVIREKIHRWLVQSLNVVAYSFAFFIWRLCNSRFSPPTRECGPRKPLWKSQAMWPWLEWQTDVHGWAVGPGGQDVDSTLPQEVVPGNWSGIHNGSIS